MGIEWIDEVPLAPLAPVTMRVLKVTGACAFGFMPGNEWVIDANDQQHIGAAHGKAQHLMARRL